MAWNERMDERERPLFLFPSFFSFATGPGGKVTYTNDKGSKSVAVLTLSPPLSFFPLGMGRF